MSDELHIRLRHTSGDIGPIEVPGSLTVEQFKERILADWPRDGALALETPTCPADLKIILSGKFLEASQVLDDLRPSMGDPKSDFIVTMHCVVRAAAFGKSSARSKDREKATGCCTVQ
ncbi:hypothetical protein ABBQ32_007557 [Trebouxia sp. C0010 RCD-2024]